MLNMKYRLFLLAFGLGLALQAQQMQMNLDQLAQFLRSELALKQHTDKQIATYLKKVQLTEKLTDKTILDLEAQGASPKIVQALQELRDQTANLKPPTADVTSSPATAPDNTLTSGPATATLGSTRYVPIPPPSSVKQREILDAMRNYAMSYTQNLPNFICVQVTRRFVDPNAGDHYRAYGTVLSKVSYNEGQEHYQVYSIDNKLVNTTMEGVKGGALSTGEFGSLMRGVFDPTSQAEFNWEKWTTLRGKRTAVFNYFIDSGHSSYSIDYGSGEAEQRIITAYKGLVYADPNTGAISRIKFIAVNIPRSFPVQEASETLDYDEADISNQKFVVPLSAQMQMTAGRERDKNDIEFRDYRKFGVESGIVSYDGAAPAPLPKEKTEEQPAAASTAAPEQTTPAKPAAPQQSGPFTPLPAAPPPPPTTPQ